MPYDVNESLDNLGNFQTNRDQTLGEVIAKAAALISQGAHRGRGCTVHGNPGTCSQSCPGRNTERPQKLEEH